MDSDSETLRLLQLTDRVCEGISNSQYFCKQNKLNCSFSNLSEIEEGKRPQISYVEGFQSTEKKTCIPFVFINEDSASLTKACFF